VRRRAIYSALRRRWRVVEGVAREVRFAPRLYLPRQLLVLAVGLERAHRPVPRGAPDRGEGRHRLRRRRRPRRRQTERPVRRRRRRSRGPVVVVPGGGERALEVRGKDDVGVDDRRDGVEAAVGAVPRPPPDAVCRARRGPAAGRPGGPAGRRRRPRGGRRREDTREEVRRRRRDRRPAVGVEAGRGARARGAEEELGSVTRPVLARAPLPVCHDRRRVHGVRRVRWDEERRLARGQRGADERDPRVTVWARDERLGRRPDPEPDRRLDVGHRHHRRRARLDAPDGRGEARPRDRLGDHGLDIPVPAARRRLQGHLLHKRLEVVLVDAPVVVRVPDLERPPDRLRVHGPRRHPRRGAVRLLPVPRRQPDAIRHAKRRARLARKRLARRRRRRSAALITLRRRHA